MPTLYAGYEWVILSGGPPTTPSNGACRTGSAVPAVEALQTTNVGLWLYASTPYNVLAAALMMKEVQAQNHLTLSSYHAPTSPNSFSCSMQSHLRCTHMVLVCFEGMHPSGMLG